MGTTYAIKVSVPKEKSIEENVIANKIDRALQDINQTMSTYIEDSELMQLNAQPAGEVIQLSDRLFDVLEISQDVSVRSLGAFDVTIGPLVNLWGFGPDKTSSIPSEKDLVEAQKKLGFDAIVLNRETKTIRKSKQVWIDLSAVAKGYATDIIAELIEKEGIVHYMVEIGGELKIRGFNHQNRLWTIGIEKPALGREGAMQALSGDNIAIATSGDYRNYYEENGVRISHTIDPKTGRPINHSLASVTVVVEGGGYADAYATALNVMGPVKGMALAEKENLAVYMIVKKGNEFHVQYTDAFKQYMVN